LTSTNWKVCENKILKLYSFYKTSKIMKICNKNNFLKLPKMFD